MKLCESEGRARESAGMSPTIPVVRFFFAPLMLQCSNKSLTLIPVYGIMNLERREHEQRSFENVLGICVGSKGQGAGLISPRSLLKDCFPFTLLQLLRNLYRILYLHRVERSSMKAAKKKDARIDGSLLCFFGYRTIV